MNWHRDQWHADLNTVIQNGGVSLKTGNMWNYSRAIIYCEEESVSHGWLSTSAAKESSINVRQTTECRRE